ncbi:MAG TPA: gluconate 2-dehydrogenase subunit 3 family protein [Terriglobia bacterium]|nr:gluconate 2-dehydrogenase subunit 3 family protein [Terriglobia bacterium]
MKKNQHSTTDDSPSRSKSGISRREMVRRLMMAGGAGLSVAGLAEGHPIVKHLTNHNTVAAASAKAAKADWSPAFLDQHQSETLDVLGERIVPGSSKAQVNRFIDLLLSVDTQDAQKKFLASLSAFEAESLKRFSHPYKEVSENQQNEILESASTTKPADVAESRPQRTTMRDHFENIKNWIVGAYYSSEIGMKELGWTGQVVFPSFPGCQDSVEHRA